MKHFTKITFTFALLFIVDKLLAQVGVSDLPSYAPNSKAMLDISSGNGVEKKGLLIPRMTSAQRVAITSPSLGLMVFETTSNTFWYYNGTTWVNMGSGGGSLILPYSALQADAGTLFSMSNSGTGRAGVFEINNGANTNQALYVGSNGLGRSGYFRSTNPANNAATLISENLGLGQAIYGTNFGTGKAGVFEINNGSNNSIALHAITNGTGRAAYFQGTNALETNGSVRFGGSGVGTIAPGNVLTTDAVGNATWQPVSTATVVAPLNLTSTSTTLLSTATGASGNAGYFNITNAANTSEAVNVSTSGAGTAARIQISNASNEQTALHSTTNGTGGAGFFRINNSLNAAPSLYSSTNGTSRAAFFEIQNASSFSQALLAKTNGMGTAGYFENTNLLNTDHTLYSTTDGLGHAGQFRINNASNPSFAIYAHTNGTGKAAYFQGTNALETDGTIKFGGSGVGIPSAGKVLTSTDGLGNASWQAIPGVVAPLSLTSTDFATLQSTATGETGHAGLFKITNALNFFQALYSETKGTGHAASFYIDNASNTSNAIRAQTSGTGAAAYFQGTNALETDGTIKFAGAGVGVIGAGKVLTSDASGNATWQAIPAPTAPLSLSSTATTLTSTSTAGTAANFSSTSGYALITGAGNVGIGIATPTAKFETSGTIKFAGSGVGVIGAGKVLTSDAAGNATWQAIPGVVAPLTLTSTATTLQSTATGTSGYAGLFRINNASNFSFALESTTNGTGRAGSFTINNAANGAAALLGESNGTGQALYAAMTGTGKAGVFEVNNSTNSSFALQAMTNGTGTTFLANHTGASGNIGVFQSVGANVARIDKTGRGYFNNGTQSSGADIAEAFDVVGQFAAYEAGDVLVISINQDRTVEKSSKPYSDLVAGVYATKPGVLLSEENIETDISDKVPMGVVGVIPTKVCNEGGAIKRGDFLVTSSKAGYAMKADRSKLGFGQIIGKALQDFEKIEGKIKVLVNVK